MLGPTMLRAFNLHGALKIAKYYANEKSDDDDFEIFTVNFKTLHPFKYPGFGVMSFE